MGALDSVIAASLPLVPKALVSVFAKPYVAGETLSDQLRVIQELNSQGFMVASGILGEFVTRREESEQAVREYQQCLDEIAARKLDSTIHTKPTHLGLKLDKEFCYQNMRKILEHARGYGNFMRMDMEDSPCIDDTSSSTTDCVRTSTTWASSSGAHAEEPRGREKARGGGQRPPVQRRLSRASRLPTPTSGSSRRTTPCSWRSS
jgi:proline dehydrogenase